MSIIEKIDTTIEKLIADLAREYSSFTRRPTDERKAQIIKEIAALRDSMNPKCDCQK